MINALQNPSLARDIWTNSLECERARKRQQFIAERAPMVKLNYRSKNEATNARNHMRVRGYRKLSMPTRPVTWFMDWRYCENFVILSTSVVAKCCRNRRVSFVTCKVVYLPEPISSIFEESEKLLFLFSGNEIHPLKAIRTINRIICCCSAIALSHERISRKSHQDVLVRIALSRYRVSWGTRSERENLWTICNYALSRRIALYALNCLQYRGKKKYPENFSCAAMRIRFN